VLDFGAFVELEKGIEGLIHVSEISDQRVEDPREVLKPGQEVKAEIISIDAAERKIGLSMKAAARSEELAEAQGYTAGTSGATLGDVYRNKLKGFTKHDQE
jgi:small subunit ribosomal protein S1